MRSSAAAAVSATASHLATCPAPLRLQAEDASVLPRTGVVLIGTRQAVAALAAQVEAMARAPVVAGCVLVGAGSAGTAIVPVLGGLGDLARLHGRYGFRFALVSLPAGSAAAEEVRQALESLTIPFRMIPTLEELLAAAEHESGSAIQTAASPPLPRDRVLGTDLAALVGRAPHRLDRLALERVLTGKRVLITGAGGSIGSELALLAAELEPELLILMERSENALFEINRRLGERFPGVPRRAVLHDVVDAEGTLRHLVALRPHAVYHAAAHKHVPLMEDHPAHAVTNNLFGTRAIADAALAVSAERFVLISTDKAVNPVSVMGASKRLAEMYVRSLAVAGTATRLSMVRFGNVLGSAGSVLTIWESQMDATSGRGPITVTDPRMTRYFMTIPEAAALVMQSSAAGDADAGTEIAEPISVAPVFVLDMGEPVRILDLALRFIRAHGRTPRILWDSLPPGTADLLRTLDSAAAEDHGGAGPVTDITFTGIRPGEKLHEELAYAAELLRPTACPGINAWAGPAPEGTDALAGLQMIADLSAVRSSPDRNAILAAMRRHIPEMPQGMEE